MFTLKLSLRWSPKGRGKIGSLGKPSDPSRGFAKLIEKLGGGRNLIFDPSPKSSVTFPLDRVCLAALASQRPWVMSGALGVGPHTCEVRDGKNVES
jgi:hypothetical protein